MPLLGPGAFWSGYPGLPEILIILLIALVLFGNRLPQIARSLGKGLLEFKRGLRGFSEEFQGAAGEEETTPDAKPVETTAKPADTAPSESAAQDSGSSSAAEQTKNDV